MGYLPLSSQLLWRARAPYLSSPWLPAHSLLLSAPFGALRVLYAPPAPLLRSHPGLRLPLRSLPLRFYFPPFWGSEFLIIRNPCRFLYGDYDLIQENGPPTHRTFLPETMVKNTRIMNKDDCCHFLHTESPGTMIAGN